MVTPNEPARIERALAQFQALCDLPKAERRRRLDDLAREDPGLAREVEALLDADERESDLDRSAAAFVAKHSAEAAGAEPLPDRIGEFTVLGVLGSGGMGLVYEALQDAPRRTVALKVIRPGLLSLARLRRFQQEAEVLGCLDHPGIARVFGAGTAETATGPLPYIAMELVRGVPLDRFARERALDVRSRVALLAELCDAVQHAHERGIVHRDLKPLNVLVTEDGRPKVLDFGVARMTEADVSLVSGATEVGEILGTLPYMSPEQVAADPALVDARSDVYGLGAMAYELLSGRTPLDVRRKSLAEAARVIVEEEPTRLGLVEPGLAGDLEVIVGKALAKDKDARYATARMLGEDLRRILTHEPILARPPRRIDQWRKFARRNPGLVGALAVAFGALSVAVVVTSVALSRTRHLLDERNAEIAIADEAIGFLEGMFARTDPVHGADVPLSEAVKQAAERFSGELRDKPVLRARLANSIGKVLLDVALGERALPLLEEALAARLAAFGPRSVEYAETLERVAYARVLVGDVGRAVELQRQVLEIRRERLPDSELLMDAMSNLSGTLSQTGRFDEAEGLLEEALALGERVLGHAAPRTVWVRIAKVGALMASGRTAVAEAAGRALLDDTTVQLDGSQRIQVYQQLAWALRLQERYADTLPVLDTAMALAEEHYGSDGFVQRELYGLKAAVLTGLERTAEAVAIMRDLAARVAASEGPESIAAARAIADLAYVVHDLPDPERREAEALYREADRIFSAKVGPRNGMSARVRHNCAMLLEALGRLDDAEALSRDSYDVRRELLGESDAATLASLRGLAGIRERQGAYEDAALLWVEYLGRAAPILGDGAYVVQHGRLSSARVLGRLGRGQEAQAMLALAESHLGGTNDPDTFRAALERTRAGLQEGGPSSE